MSGTERWKDIELLKRDKTKAYRFLEDNGIRFELQAVKAMSWTSDKEFLEMLKAARKRRARTD